MNSVRWRVRVINTCSFIFYGRHSTNKINAAFYRVCRQFLYDIGLCQHFSKHVKGLFCEKKERLVRLSLCCPFMGSSTAAQSGFNKGYTFIRMRTAHNDTNKYQCRCVYVWCVCVCEWSLNYPTSHRRKREAVRHQFNPKTVSLERGAGEWGKAIAANFRVAMMRKSEYTMSFANLLIWKLIELLVFHDMMNCKNAIFAAVCFSCFPFAFPFTFRFSSSRARLSL